MGIKGLTDQKRPTFPKIGDIRKGAEKKENRPGKDLTYFRYAPIEGEEAAAEVFAEEYGEQPREVNIFLPFDSVDRNFEAWMERHTAGALQCRGDGDVCHLWRDDDGKMHHEKRPCGELDVCDKCTPSGRLKVIIPELRRLAYVTVHTTSKWDIVELTENLQALRQLTGNGLKGIPLVLKRRPREISTPRGNGKRVRMTKWLLSIEADQRWVDQSLKQIEQSAMPNAPQLEAGNEAALECDEDTGEVIEAEIVEEPEPEIKDRVQLAKEYTTAKGTVLGECNVGELESMLNQLNEMENPGEKAQTVKGHIEVLLDYVSKFSADGEQEALPF